MIIYGTGGTNLATDKPAGISCPKCNTQGSIEMAVASRHAHVFWIPLFPIGKSGIAVCHNCGVEIKPKRMPEDLRMAYDNMKVGTKTPIWQFAGLALIVILIGVGYFMGKQTEKNERAYLEAPIIGDVYEIEVEDGAYSSLKVIGVSADSVQVVPNEYLINIRSEVSEIDIPENYLLEDSNSYKISRANLQNLYEEKTLYGVNRD